MTAASRELDRTSPAAGPEIVVNRPRPRARVSVILLDWNVRESFHSLYYLNNQTVPRESYDLVWVEFYDRRPAALREAVERWGEDGPAVDKWIVLGYDDGVYFHKHRMYNVGILAADGEICVICDSDAMFPPNFIESVVAAFEENPEIDLYLDRSRRVLRALGRGLASRLMEAGIRTTRPRGGFYLFPDFRGKAKQLRAKGIRTSPELCERLLDDTGVAILPGSSFGRDPEELTARISYVNFNGARALEGAARTEADGGTGELDEAFLREYCGDCLEAVDRIHEWVDSG